jgi:hypothetical protein
LAFSLGSGSVTRQQPNNEVLRSSVESVARQRPVSNNGVVFALESVLRARCHGNIFLLITIRYKIPGALSPGVKRSGCEAEIQPELRKVKLLRAGTHK